MTNSNDQTDDLEWDKWVVYIGNTGLGTKKALSYHFFTWAFLGQMDGRETIRLFEYGFVCVCFFGSFFSSSPLCMSFLKARFYKHALIALHTSAYTVLD